MFTIISLNCYSTFLGYSPTRLPLRGYSCHAAVWYRACMINRPTGPRDSAMGFWTSDVRLRPVWPPHPATSLRASTSGSTKAVDLRRPRAADLLLGSSPCVAETMPGHLRRRSLGMRRRPDRVSAPVGQRPCWTICTAHERLHAVTCTNSNSAGICLVP